MVQALEKFDIRNFSDQLTSAKEKNRYYCPVCENDNLTIDPKTGKYQCWNGCSCNEVREAISPWANVAEERQSNYKPRSKRVKTKGEAPTPAPIPEGRLTLLRLPAPATDSPLPQKPQFIPKGVPSNAQEIVYSYSYNQRVSRFEWEDSNNPKGHDKTFRQWHINQEGFPVWNKGDELWDAYRLDEAIQFALNHRLTGDAYKADENPVLLAQEGEDCVEIARRIQLASITWQGSDWSEKFLISSLQKIKSIYPPVTLAFLRDNDSTGIKKAEKLTSAANQVGIPCLIVDPVAICPELPDKGDIKEILAAMDSSEFIKRLEEQFNAAADAAREEQYDRVDAEDTSDEWDDPSSFNPLNPKEEFTQFTLDALYGDKPWICFDNKLHYWTGTHYKYSPDPVEIERIANWCNLYAVPSKDKTTGEVTFKYPYAKPSKVKEAMEWVKMRLSVAPDLINPEGLNCTNGVLWITWQNKQSSWELIDHDPNLYYTYEPMVKYDPEANPEACDRLLEVLDAPQRDIFLKTIAASLDLETVRKYKGRLVRALLLKGHGSNGKDTLREAVSAMYGHQGMTGKTLSDFTTYDEGRKFPLAPLKFSRVNWASENANTTRLDKIQSLKAFITGDNLDSEHKGQDENPFKPKGIALFNVNDTPNLQGTLEAIKSRYGVLLFNKTFKVGADPSKGELEADPRFKDDPEFLKTEVLPAFLNRVLDALVRLMSEGIDYSCTEKALEDIQAENSHLFQFCKDTGLNYDPSNVLTASDIWTRLEQWYLENGTLTHEEGSNGKQKAIWAEQSKPSDRNVKAVNQVITRFRAIFPKAKLVTVPHESGKKGIQALQGIGFICGGNPPDGYCDNKSEFSTPIHPSSTPVPPQSPPQKTTENQGFHLTHPNFLDSVEKNEFSTTIEPCNVDQNQKVSDTPQELGWVRCDDAKSSLLGVDDWGGTGVEIAEIGVETIPDPWKSNLEEPEAIAPAIPTENTPEAMEAVADVETPQPIAAKPASEILASGEAVGRMAHTRNIKREISRESWRITKWCDRNAFYTLENGETAYPCSLILAT